MPSDVFSPQEALSTALSAQGLLFAAFGLAIGLKTTKRLGQTQGAWASILAWAITAVIAILGIAGVSAWADLVGDPNWPSSCYETVESIAFLGAIVALPVIAVFVNLKAKAAT